MSHRRLQTKVYQCSKCGEAYLHGGAYVHHGFRCPKRVTGKQTASRPVIEQVARKKSCLDREQPLFNEIHLAS